MSLVLCPECGTKISDRATICPHCGYVSNDSSRPISQQDQYSPVPLFEYDIEEWKPNRDELTEVSIEDGKRLYQYFGVWINIEKQLPQIAQVIKALAEKESFLVADYDKYVSDLIKKGVYRFKIDKKGEILPTIRNDEGKIVCQVRLKEMSFAPQLNQAMNNFRIHAQLALILDEIEYVGDAIKEIHQELQNDRIALAESAWDKMRQARRIQDSRLRESAILEAIGGATDAKRVLMRNFVENKAYIEDRSQKSFFEMIPEYKKDRDVPSKAVDSFQDLFFVTNCVRMECEGYALLGEYDACKESLVEFRDFILDNKLNDKNTLLRLNMSLKAKLPSVVMQFTDIAQRISKFDTSIALDASALKLLEVSK